MGRASKIVHLVALHGETMRTGEARGPRADDGNALARGRGAVEEVPLPRHDAVGGVALEPPDLHRLALGRLPHAGALAEFLGRADARAHAAEDVLLEDRLPGRLGLPGRDLADEERDVDLGRAGLDAGRIVAEIAPVRGDRRLVHRERLVQIGEVFRDLLGGQSRGRDAWGQRVGHVLPPCRSLLCGQTDTNGIFIKR